MTTTDTITVIEVDQWTSTGDIRDQDFDHILADPACALEGIHGNDAEAIRKIFGGLLQIKQVSAADRPRLGNVWFIRGEDGKPELWKANYDSSD